MKTTKRKIGDIGEALAVRYLVGLGYRILDRNYLKSVGEIDIVAERNRYIYFFEVKTVTREKISRVTGDGLRSDEFRAEDNLHRAKIDRVIKTAFTYMSEKGMNTNKFKINAIIVEIDKESKRAKISVIEDINE